MKEKTGYNWPAISQDAEQPLALYSFDDWQESDYEQDGIVAVTDGWRDGPLAAVLRGGNNARAVLDLLARSGVKDLQIIHLEEKLPQLEEIFLSSVVAPANAMFDHVNVRWQREASLPELLTNIGGDYAMLFFGAPLAASELLPLQEKIRAGYDGGISIVRGPISDIDFDEADEINKWVRARTYDAADFALAAVLKNYKKKLGKRIAVILPSLNEAKTVGKVIKTALEVQQAGIIDEVILMDSASTDNTVEIARSYGIPVYLHQQVRPELGAYRGKGEAMFKSALVTEADILAWIDTDIETITPRFFYGLLGPLLADAGIRYSKGYFARPVRVEASGIEVGGGRVTELLARPWINTFMPELSGYIQPLSGAVAIYREDLLKMRIPVNYGVEIAMLIQVVQQAGLWATCQVNLGDVVHRSKDVVGLSEMAFQITSVLADMGQRQPGSRPNENFRRVYSAHGQFEIGIKKFKTVWRDFSRL